MLPHGHALVAVGAVGLNFRDVLNVLGMYPGDPGAPGSNFVPSLEALCIFECPAPTRSNLRTAGAC